MSEKGGSRSRLVVFLLFYFFLLSRSVLSVVWDGLARPAPSIPSCCIKHIIAEGANHKVVLNILDHTRAEGGEPQALRFPNILLVLSGLMNPIRVVGLPNTL